MMNDVFDSINTLGFMGPIGWQELLILGICPLFTVGIVLLVLYFTGVIGGKKKQ